MLRTDRLTTFLAEGAALPFVWGERDCCPWVASWIMAETGLDPSAAVRGAYRSRLECERFLKREGGIVAAVTRLMAGVGLPGTESPQLGDVGLVETAAGVMGGICLGGAWAMKTVDGIVIAPAPQLKAWSL